MPIHLTAAIGLLTGTGAANAQVPDEVVLNGMVRDFRESHADFQVLPPEGVAHCVGLVDMQLDVNGMPIFVGGGLPVLTQAQDAMGRNIAPHMANVTCGGGVSTPPLVTKNRIRARNTSMIDAYKSDMGAYGGGNIADSMVVTNSIAAGMLVIDNSSALFGDGMIGPGGDAGVVVDVQGTLTGSIGVLPSTIPIPTVSEPVGLPVYPGDLDVPMNASVVIDQNWHIQGEFDIKRNSTVTINGNLTIVCENRWLIGRNAQVIIPNGSSLTIYCRTMARLYGNDTVVNPDTSNPSKLKVFILGNDPWNDQLVLNGTGTMMCAQVVAPDNVLDLDQSAQFFGTFAGMEVEINNQSKLHVDLSGGGMGSPSNDTDAVLGSTPSDAAVSSAASFAKWFANTPGDNLAMPLSLTLVRKPGDIFVFDDVEDAKYAGLGGFYPIDGLLFGNEGGTHNHHFTYEAEVMFTYDAGGEQFLSFEGDADCWVFVDGQLVMDVGGIHSPVEQRIDMDRLCLTDGQAYKLNFFMAERYAPSSSLRLETNIVLDDSFVETAFAPWD